MTPDIDWTRLVRWGHFRYVNERQRLEMEAMHSKAEEYVGSLPGFETIVDAYLGLSESDIIGVFLFFARADNTDKWTWVVVGDVPPLHIGVAFARNQYQAVNSYVGEVEHWIAVQQGSEDAQEPVAPIAHATAPDALLWLRNKMNVLAEHILTPAKHLL